MDKDPTPSDMIPQQTRVIQIINAAYGAGRPDASLYRHRRESLGQGRMLISIKPLPDLTAPLPLVGILMAIGCGVVSWFVPARLWPNARRAIVAGTWKPPQQDDGQSPFVPTTDAGRFMTVYITQHIIKSALLEGAAFFNLIIFLIEGNPLSLLIGLLLAGALLAGFPTRDRIENWLADQIERMRTE